jgi:hypothetical protein
MLLVAAERHDCVRLKDGTYCQLLRFCRWKIDGVAVDYTLCCSMVSHVPKDPKLEHSQAPQPSQARLQLAVLKKWAVSAGS